MTEIAAFENNSEAIEAWNTVLFEKFSRFQDILTKGLGSHGAVVLERHPPREGSRVLDLGCGFGDTTIEIARSVGSRGKATGVDAAARFIEIARRDAKEIGMQNAEFLVADVQHSDLGGPYDQAFSRFGTMFFASPVAAFRNVRRALVPGALFSMVVWRRKDDNPFMHLAEQRVLEILPHPEKGDQVTCGPGPFSMASPDLVSAQLLSAGFERITFERVDLDVRVGKDLDETIEFALNLGPAGEIMRLAGEVGEQRKPEIVAALQQVFADFERPNGFYGKSSSWIVTARAT